MKNPKTQGRALFVPLALGLIAAAQAQFTLIDDFEGYAPGANGTTATPAWIQGWPAGGAGNASTTAVGADAASGQALRYTYGGAGGQINHSAVGTIAAEGTTGTIFFQAYLDVTGSDTLFAFGRAGLGAYGDLGVLVRVPSDLIVEVHNGAYANTTTTIAADTLYSFWVVIDNAANTADVYYSAGDPAGAPVLIQSGFVFRSATAGDINTFYLGTNGGSLGFIDNIHIDPTGENLTNPTFTDEDGDGLEDGWETANGLDPGDDGTTGESSAGAKDGPNGALGDPDGDDLNNLAEYQNGTDPQDDDTDGDELKDGEEFAGTTNAYDGSKTDPLLADTDGDGVSDFNENGGLNTQFANAPTNPNSPDTDGDGMDDGYELANNNPGTALDPNDNGSDDPTQDPLGHRDGDGLANLDEYQAVPRTRADLADTDGDSLNDNVEDNFGSWGGAGFTGTDPTKPDTDGDGLFDNEENYDLSVSNGGGGFPGAGVKPTNSDPNLLDTDGDGYGDLYEVNAGTDPDDAGAAPAQPAGFNLVENFEGAGMTIGGTFSGVNGWMVQNPAATTVVDEPIEGGDQVGSFVRPAGAAASSFYKSLTAIGLQVFEGGSGTLFLQIYAPGSGLDNSFGFSDVQAPGNDFGAYEAQLVLAGAASELRVRDAAAFRLQGNHRVGAWMNVWIVADNAADTVRIFVESPAGGTGQVEITDDGGVDPFNFRNGTTEALSSLFFIQNSGENLPVLFDNVYVDPGAVNLATPAAAKPVAEDLRITNVFFDGGDLKITFSPGGTGKILTSSNDLVSPFAEETDAVFDGVDTFTVPAASLNPGKDFFRVESP